ncbi:antA/AntB antirepressor family protein [Kushneria sp. AK178]
MHAQFSAAPVTVFSGTINAESAQLVDARDLHAFLDVGKRFASWISDRVGQYGFEQGVDFLCVSQNRETQRKNGQRGISRTTEYHLTLDMAKELSMVERNEKGRQARRYFIQCEKRLQQIDPEETETIAQTTIGTDGFHVLSGLVDSRVRHLPKGIKASVRARLWSQVHIAYNVKAANEIPADQFDSARQFVAAAAIEGDYLAASRDEPAQSSQIDLPLATGLNFENIPNSHLFGGDLMHHSCLSALFAELRTAAREGNAVRVRELAGAWEEVKALRSRLETVLRRDGEQKMLIDDLQQHLSSANRVAGRLR